MFTSTRQIFILDDDQDDLDILSIAFNETCNSCKVYTATHFCELNSMLLKLTAPPAVILLDLNMPLMSGIECLRKIRENKITSGFPVIIFSTCISEKDRAECQELGVNKFLLKPTCFEDLKKIATSICEYSGEKNQSQKRTFPAF